MGTVKTERESIILRSGADSSGMLGTRHELIWKDWKNYVDYKEGNFSIIESQDIVQEAMIQWHLREQGIELKCYGLNTFPNSEELKQYYE